MRIARVSQRAALAVVGALLLPGAIRAGEALELGNAAFREGRFEDAAKAYESEEDAADLLTRRYTAGVSWARAGQGDKALERFEDVSARAEGDLRRRALYNAGHASFERGKALARGARSSATADEPGGAGKDLDARMKDLTEAVRAYKSAEGFFRSIEPPDNDTLRGIAVTKTALRAALDEIARIHEERRREAEEEALKEPAALLAAIIEKERIHRSLSRGLEKAGGSDARLGARRLRKSEAENRALAEKLHHHLAQPEPQPPAPPAGANDPPPTPDGGEETKARKEHAAGALLRAIEAQKDAEVAYAKIDHRAASGHHTRAIAELRSALEAFPIEIARVIAEAVETQKGVIQSVEEAQSPAMEPSRGTGSGIGARIVEALTDKVLVPLAKILKPGDLDLLLAAADDEEEVVWGSRLLSQANVDPSPAPPAESGSPHEAHAPAEPALDAEAAKALGEGLRREGAAALEASSKAKEELAAGSAEKALPEARKALEALERAAELLPKPPEPPEERLQKLIERQKGARQAAEGIASLTDDARAAALAELVRAQREDGKEAGGIAALLEARQDEPAKEASPKVREGEAQVHSSAEALERDLVQESTLAIDRDVKAFEEALALLRGEKKDEDQDQKEQQKKDEPDLAQKDDAQRQDPSKQKDGKGKEKKEQAKPYALSPREANYLRQAMDKKRRDEEAKLFTAPSRLTVPRDW
ncbi:MAG TPA: hypothetical protein VMT52_11315 [Planctomycetota bacterium]|nr:hypothetical protein [Planctomycetota bacterium]